MSKLAEGLRAALGYAPQALGQHERNAHTAIEFWPKDAAPSDPGEIKNGHYLLLRRYRNTGGGGAVGFVASVTIHGEHGEWAAYLGYGDQDYALLTEAVASHGVKTDTDLAAVVFPELPLSAWRA